jgi:hypothetical protein
MMASHPSRQPAFRYQRQRDLAAEACQSLGALVAI